MTTGIGPYVVPIATDLDDTGLGSPVIETTLVASQLATANIGNGLGATTHVEVFNGTIPGPTFKLKVDDTVVVRLVNDLPYPTGIHWHGVELENCADGTEITQDGALGAPLQTLGNGVQAGGTFLYKFKVPRAGLFWYHPHHHNSINRVFKGMYGMIVVTDPLETNLTNGVLPNGKLLPAPADTLQLVLSDITVAKSVNDATTYVDPTTIAPASDRPEWLSGASAQTGPTPKQLCEIPPGGSATNDDGTAAVTSYVAGEVPSIARGGGRLTEGQIVLTNGVYVGGRKGTPGAPTALDATAIKYNILSGQGLRLQIVNCATLRYMRLRLTTQAGVQVPLFRIGGEGGLLDKPILEGGTIGTVDTRYLSGEILLTPAGRADVVAAIPAGLAVGTVLTLWTRDYQRTGGSNPGNWAQLPTVPVMHLNVTGAVGTAYTISTAVTLRASAGMPLVQALGVPNATLLNPAAIAKTGSAVQDIKFQTGGNPNIDGAAVPMTFMDPSPHYTDAPHLASTRYAAQGTVPVPSLLELTVTNTSQAHHPFHLHGFSFQPVKITPRTGGTAVGSIDPWPFKEFRDTIDLLPDYTLTFRAKLDDRPLADGVTGGGAMGRWLFHCHIFFHHMQGMISEFVVTPTTNGKEKPNVNVGGSWAFAMSGGTATRKGTFFHRDGLQMILTASKGTVSPAVLSAGGNWTWSYTPVAADPPLEYVYITATDSAGRKDQAVFRLQVGGLDLGSDTGDPHIRTVDGKLYDFQSAGEFTLLRDRDGMEIQVRQTPVETPPPVTDNYTGLTSCVSLNTAVAARVGSHRISYQPGRDRGQLTFYVDGKPTDLPLKGLDLGADRVSTFSVGGVTGLRIDYGHGPVVQVTPIFWTSYGLWYLDINISNTNGDEGIMGRIHNGTWLPTLRSGATVGPMPESLHERYITLNQAFADSWRLTDETSMFFYRPWTSTATFTDRDWPSEKPPCKLKYGFQTPITPILENIPLERAKAICKDVKFKDLHQHCVFDVQTTGDPAFAKGYLVAQELRHRSCVIQIISDKSAIKPGQSVTVTAIVIPMHSGREQPEGDITFHIDGKPRTRTAELNEHGRAHLKVTGLKAGEHKIRATYSCGERENHYHDCSSPNLLVTVGRSGREGTLKPVPKPMMTMAKKVLKSKRSKPMK